MIKKAVVLAAGSATRMKKKSNGVTLDEFDVLAIEKGLKGMIRANDQQPIADLLIRNLIEAGVNHIIFVVSEKGKEMMENYYGKRKENVKFSYAVQEKPLGTANAVLSAENYTDKEPFIVLCYDNVYPLDALKKLLEHDSEWSTVGFERTTLEDKSRSNLKPEKIRQCAVMQINDNYHLVKIVEAAEKQENYISFDGNIYLSMGLFGFDNNIFDACRNIKPRERKPGKIEYELPDAISYGIGKLNSMVIIPGKYSLVDLTSQENIEEARKLVSGRKLSF
jgi:dTDP-glucose pyrophosphorylase